MLVCKECGHVEFFDKYYDKCISAENREKAKLEAASLLEEIEKYQKEIKELEDKIINVDESSQFFTDSKN